MWRHAATAWVVQLVLAGTVLAAAPVELPAPGMLKADNSIESLTRVGSRVILTGAFHHIGPYVGGAVGLDPESGARDPGFARLDGQVSDALADGSGGWYVAGQFLVAGEQRAVAHVLPSGDIDPRFDARLHGFATALSLFGERLYVGRWFGNARLVGVDRRTGARLQGFHAPRLAEVTELHAGFGRIYAGTTRGVTALSLVTGERDTGFDCATCRDRVMALAGSGTRLYVGLRDQGVIAVDRDTGRHDEGFAPTMNTTTGNGEDHGPLVLLPDGDRLIVGGSGLRLGGPSTTLAALDLRTGRADPAFGRGFANPIHDMAIDGASLFVAGAPRAGRTAPVIKLDPATGAYEDALTPELDGPIDALAGGGDRLFVGGRFGAAHRMRTAGVAAVDLRTGRLLPGFRVRDMPRAAFAEAPIVAGDSLIFPYEQPYGRVARAVAFSARTGVRRAGFAPSPIRFESRFPWGTPTWAADGDRVYVAYPTGPGEADQWPSGALRVLSAHSGRRLAGYALPYDGYVRDLLPHMSQLFVAGSFRRYFADGTPRHLATLALDPMTGAVDDGFDAHTDGPVEHLEGFRDRLYLSGYFDHAYGRARDDASSAYDNTGAVVAGFPAIDVFGSGDRFVTAHDRHYRVVAADPYTGRSYFRVPGVRPGYVGSALPTRRGVYVTATLNLPFYGYGGYYDNYAAFVRPVG